MARIQLAPGLNVTSRISGEAGSITVTIKSDPWTIGESGLLTARIAEIVRAKLSANLAKGKDAEGRSLPQLSEETIARRRRRQKQAQASSAVAERLGGRSVIDLTTPLHESGTLSDGLAVVTTPQQSAIAAPVKGPDGRGNREEALAHYDVDLQVPSRVEKQIETAIGEYIDKELR